MTIDLNFIYNVVIMILSIAGAYLASSSHHRHRLYGYGIWCISNGAIAIIFWQSGNVPQTITFILYEALNVRGIYSNLTRKDTNDKR